MTFYEKLLEVCAQKNTTPTAVCRAIGLSDAAATKWKRDGATPRDITLKKIADHLGVNVNYFKRTYLEHGHLYVNHDLLTPGIHLSQEEKEAMRAEQEKRIAEEIMLDKLIALFHQVPEKDRKLVVNMVEAALQTRSAKPDTDEEP